MNINELLWGAIAILAVLAVALACCWQHRKRKAKHLVAIRGEQEKYAEVNHALEPFGFAYSLSKDIFYSLEDA